MGYTWAQATAYLRLGRCRAARDRQERLFDMRLAFAADAKPFLEMTATLHKLAQG